MSVGKNPEGARGVKIIVKILDKAVCILHSANTLRKDV